MARTATSEKKLRGRLSGYLRRLGKKRQLALILVLVAVCAGIGYKVHTDTRAANIAVSAEAENGTLKTAVIVNDTSASNNKAVKFGTATPTQTARFAGHIPGRVLLGMAASSSIRPLYDEALGITGTVYERRQFKSNWITASAMNSMLNDCDAKNQYCVISFKVPNNDWAGVTAGKYDSDLDIAMNVARQRAKPFAFAVHHEPEGDGTPTVWGAMQEYLVQYLSPVSDKMAFTTIGNGWWWGPNGGKPDSYIAQFYPQSLLNKMNQYNGIVAGDFYDAHPKADGTFGANADRTSQKLQGFVNWAKAKGVKNLGVGEFGTATGPELTNSWRIIQDNRDMFGYANYFNSLANSDFDWRLIPDSYPIYSPSNSLDLGGTPVSEARLNAFKAALAESAIPR